MINEFVPATVELTARGVAVKLETIGVCKFEVAPPLAANCKTITVFPVTPSEMVILPAVKAFTIISVTLNLLAAAGVHTAVLLLLDRAEYIQVIVQPR